MSATEVTTPREEPEGTEALSRGSSEVSAPKVWVGCLACYNGGSLVGEWFDATDCPTDMAEFNHELRPVGRYVDRAAPLPAAHILEAHEELWVFDHEGFHGLLKSECSPVEAQRLAEAIGGIGSDGHPVAAVAAWLSNAGESLTEWDRPTREGFEDSYQGEYDSERAFAEELAYELDALPRRREWPLNCIDWDQATRELFMGDYWSESTGNGTVYVFRSV